MHDTTISWKVSLYTTTKKNLLTSIIFNILHRYKLDVDTNKVQSEILFTLDLRIITKEHVCQVKTWSDPFYQTLV